MDKEGEDFDIYADLDFDIIEDNKSKVKIYEKEDEKEHDDHNSTQDKQNRQKQEKDYETVDNLLLNDVSIIEDKYERIEYENKLLLGQNDKLKCQLDESQRLIKILKTNISSLYKTAKAEIGRKKREIDELRSEYDTIIFRRNHKHCDLVQDFDNKVVMRDKWTMTDRKCHCKLNSHVNLTSQSLSSSSQSSQSSQSSSNHDFDKLDTKDENKDNFTHCKRKFGSNNEQSDMAKPNKISKTNHSYNHKSDKDYKRSHYHNHHNNNYHHHHHQQQNNNHYHNNHNDYHYVDYKHRKSKK